MVWRSGTRSLASVVSIRSMHPYRNPTNVAGTHPDMHMYMCMHMCMHMHTVAHSTGALVRCLLGGEIPAGTP